MSIKWRAGELDQRISVVRETITTDGYGGQELVLSTLLEAWSKVIPRAGNERLFGDRVEATGDYMFIIRNRSDVTIEENDRILWRGKYYNISFIADAGDRDLYLQIMASRGVAQ